MSASLQCPLESFEVYNFTQDFPKRGGMSMTTVEDSLFVIFGGVDRQQEHFQDLLVGSVENNKIVTKVIECNGDVPNPRSGHSMVSYGPYIFLFGGIDFMEEAVFNDLYILDTKSWTWSYVGESGHEVIGRNSQSMAILEDNGNHVLVIFGGASPEHGPLSDTIYANLPRVEEIDVATIAVHWNLLATREATSCPKAIEMQSTCAFGNQLIISGGRDIDGNFSADTWILSLSCVVSPVLDNSTTTDNQSNSLLVPQTTLQWIRIDSLQLPKATCAHTTFIQQTSDGLAYFCVGGISPDGLAGYVHSCSLSRESPTSFFTCNGSWTTRKIAGNAASRFGHCITAVPSSFAQVLIEGDSAVSRKLSSSIKDRIRYALTSASGDEALATATSRKGAAAAFIFGGVDPECDYNDLWIVG